MQGLALLALAALGLFLLGKKGESAPLEVDREPREPREPRAAPAVKTSTSPADADLTSPVNEKRLDYDGARGDDTAPVRVLPPGATIEVRTFGADAPLDPGMDRVTFRVRGSSTGVLEGTYRGPVDPSIGPAQIVVDRLAEKGTGDLLPGRYTVPASSKGAFHERLFRVGWSDNTPTSEGFSGFTPFPLVEVGDKATLLVDDGYGTKALAIVLVRAVEDERFSGEGRHLVVSLLKPYRILRDVGSGPISFAPLSEAQRRIETSVSRLVDPKSVASKEEEVATT